MCVLSAMCLSPCGPWYSANIAAMLARRAWATEANHKNASQLLVIRRRKKLFYSHVFSHLCSANVAGRLVSADVLLSGLQSESVHLLTSCVPEMQISIAFETNSSKIPRFVLLAFILTLPLFSFRSATHLVTPTIRPGIIRTRLSRTAKKAA